MRSSLLKNATDSAHPIIIRCRLFKTGPPNPELPRGNFAEVWDTLNNPFTGELPTGEFICCEQDVAYEHIRARVDAHRVRLGGKVAPR